MGTRTYEPIATQTATGSETSFTFSSLGSYTDIVIEIDAKNLTGNSDVLLRFNSDSGTNYSATIAGGDGSSAYSYRRTNSTSVICNYFNFLNSSTATIFRINVQSYRNGSTHTPVFIRADRSDQASEMIIGNWRSTSAITSLSIALSSSSFASNSTITLYGIKAA